MPDVNSYCSKRSDEQEEVKFYLYLCWCLYGEKYKSTHIY